MWNHIKEALNDLEKLEKKAPLGRALMRSCGDATSFPEKRQNHGIENWGHIHFLTAPTYAKEQTRSPEHFCIIKLSATARSVIFVVLSFVDCLPYCFGISKAHLQIQKAVKSNSRRYWPTASSSLTRIRQVREPLEKSASWSWPTIFFTVGPQNFQMKVSVWGMPYIFVWFYSYVRILHPQFQGALNCVTLQSISLFGKLFVDILATLIYTPATARS